MSIMPTPKTTEPCPVCQNPDAICKHSRGIHYWDCPTCGKSSAIVCYHCEICEEQFDQYPIIAIQVGEV